MTGHPHISVTVFTDGSGLAKQTFIRGDKIVSLCKRIIAEDLRGADPYFTLAVAEYITCPVSFAPSWRHQNFPLLTCNIECKEKTTRS